MKTLPSQDWRRPTGCARLLEHCATLDLVEHPRRPARQRLEEAVGPDLARLLLQALSVENVPQELTV